MNERTIAVKIRAEYAGFKSAMADIRQESDKTSANFDRNGNKITTTTGRIIRSAELNRDAWASTGRMFTLWGLSTVAALGLAARAAIQWESDWTGVLKTVSGSHDELAALEGDLRALALVKPASQGQIAAVAEAAGQLGVATSSIAKFTSIMVDLGETTNLTADEAATSIAQLMNVMQTAAGDVDNLGSTLVALGNNGASTERDIVQMAQRIAGAGKIIGLSEGEVLGLANALASVGIEVEAGGSAISNVMIDVSKSVSKGGDDLAGWAKVAGLSADEFGKKWKAEPAEALTLIVEGLGRMNASGGDVLTTLDSLGQTDVRVTRALLSMAGAGTMLRDSLTLQGQAWNDNTALTIEAGKRYDTTEAKVAMARNALNDAAITIGQDLLPMLASLAGGVSDVAGWFAALPDPVRQSLTGLTGVVGVTALVAGGFLSLLPRIMDVNRALGGTGTIAPGVVSGLKSVGAAAGVIGAVTIAVGGLSQALLAATDASRGTSEIRNNLVGLADGTTKIDGALGKAATSMEQFDSMLFAMKDREEVSKNWWNVGVLISSGIGVMTQGMDDAGQQFKQFDKAIAEFAAIDLGQAQEQFVALADAFDAQSNDDFQKILDAMPAYKAALLDAATAAGQNVDESQLLQLAMGTLTLTTEGAIVSTDSLTDSTEALATETGLTQEALDKWRETASGADAAFLAIVGAYDSAIAQNTALAESTAAATESADDSWQTYYDGVSVSSSQYIEQLQAQVDAQFNWENNMLAIAERVNVGMTGSMAAAGNAMIDELLTLGPEGAAQVELLRSMTDEEFAKVVTLWGEKGTAAVTDFTSKVEAYRHPVITPDVNFSFANSQMKTWTSGIFNVQVQPWTSGIFQKHADGGAVWGPGSGTSDSIFARLSNGEYVQRTASHAFWGSQTMQAMNNLDVGGFYKALAARGFADGGSPSSVAFPGVATYNSQSRGDTFGDVNLHFHAEDIAELKSMADVYKMARVRARQGAVRPS